MPIPTDVTIEDSFSVVDPVDVAPPGSNFEAYVETGTTQLGQGDQVHTVTFNTEKAALSYVFDELVIYNEVDATPIVLGYIETAKSTTGFELTTTATPDTGNYYVRWKVRIPTTIVEGAVVATPSTGAVVEVTAVGQDGINATVSNPTTAPTINLSLTDGSILASKLAFTPVTGAVLTPTGAQTVTNKLIDGNNNTLQNIAITAISGAGIITQGMTDPNSDQPVYWDDNAGNFAFRGTPSARGISKDVYISTRSDGKGIGTADDPFDGSTAANFDAIMADGSKTPADANIYLCAGTFLTKGFDPRSGWKLHLTPQTTLKLDVLSPGEAGALGAAKILAIFGKTGNALIQDVLIEGGTWDLNMQNQTQALCPSAIQIVCDGLTVRNLKVINFANTSPTNVECFVVGNFTNGSRDSLIHKKGVLWQNIEFTSLANGVTNTGTISLLNACGGQNISSISSLSNGWFQGVTIENCYFHDINNSDAVGIDCINIGGAVRGLQSHGNRFQNIYGSAARYAYYWDTGPGIDINIEGDQHYNVSAPVFFTNSANPAPTRKNVSISREMISLVPSGSTSPIRIEDIAATGTTEITLENNIIFLPDSGGLALANIGNVRIKNNTIDASSNEITTAGCTNVTRFNNLRPSGVAVTGEDLPVTLAASQSLTNKKLGSLTTNGFVKTSGGDGTLSVDTTARAAAGDNSDITSLVGFSSGSAGSPSIDLGSNNGFYLNGGAVIVANAGDESVGFNVDQKSQVKLRSTGKFSFSSADDLVSSSDAEITRAGAGLLGVPGLSIADTKNIVFSTGTGTKIGTLGGASGQKMAFWNQTPIVQPVLATGAGASADNIITVLQNLGLVRQS